MEYLRDELLLLSLSGLEVWSIFVLFSFIYNDNQRAALVKEMAVRAFKRKKEQLVHTTHQR